MSRNLINAGFMVLAATVAVAAGGCASVGDVFDEEMTRAQRGVEDRVDARTAQAKMKGREITRAPGDRLEDEMDKVDREIDETQIVIEGKVDEQVDKIDTADATPGDTEG